MNREPEQFHVKLVELNIVPADEKRIMWKIALGSFDFFSSEGTEFLSQTLLF